MMHTLVCQRTLSPLTRRPQRKAGLTSTESSVPAPILPRPEGGVLGLGERKPGHPARTRGGADSPFSWAAAGA